MLTLLDNRSVEGLSELPHLRILFRDSDIYIYNTFATTFMNNNNLKIIKLNPARGNFVTGFVDAEGCFMIAIRKNNKCLTGYSVQVVFQIELHKKRSSYTSIYSINMRSRNSH